MKKMLFVLGVCPYVGQVLAILQDCNIKRVIRNRINVINFLIVRWVYFSYILKNPPDFGGF
jgi:hypothetical protein